MENNFNNWAKNLNVSSNYSNFKINAPRQVWVVRKQKKSIKNTIKKLCKKLNLSW